MLLLARLVLVSAPQAFSQPQLRLEANGFTDFLRVSNIVLHVPAGSAPSPFLPPGPFRAEWTGSLVLDLREDVQFQARHAGAVSIEINGSAVLQAAHTQSTTDWSPSVRLRKGTNSLRVTLSRTNDSTSGLRLSWRRRGTLPEPIPAATLAAAEAPSRDESSKYAAARRGRHLFLLHRCGKCHQPDVAQPVPELAADAPSFVGIGDRRRREWMARWITDPRALRPSATMPRLLHGPALESEAADIATWLASQTGRVGETEPDTGGRHVPALGRALFDSLECRACHTLDANGANSTMVDLHRISEKFPDRLRLGQYLRDPGRHFKWTRMPNFRLTAEEAAHLASFLMPQDGTPTAPAREDDPARIGRGRVLAGERGCFNCHKNPDEDTAISPPASISMAPGFEALARDPGSSGCLAVTNDVDSTRPERRAAYDFRESDRADLAAFLSTGAESLGRHVPAEFAERWSAELRCGECHGKVEGIPALIGVGEKLRPEWVERMLRGEVTYKPRPWLASRMPAFSMVATELAEGYAALEGLPAIASDRDPTPHPPDPEAAAVGRKLVSASAGFSCVTCHPVGPFVASAVFEAPGINLAHAVDRLRPDFFMRWVRNPQAFDPGTRMPLYFDEEGNSALTEYYGGDGPKTLHALWEYLRAGPHLVPPDP